MSYKPDGQTRVLERPGTTPVLLLRRARFEVIKGPDRGREFPLEKPSLRVGTDPTNDVVLSDPAVSARHLELSFDERGCLLRDLASTNGTILEGYWIREVYLRHGAEVVLGETTLR